MKYLRYYRDGYFSKFPLDKCTSTIGWSSKNDLTIKDDFISNRHLKIDVKENFIIITDLGSTNGTYVKGGKIKEAVIKMGESFNIGGREFVLKEGNLKEFKAAKELIPYIDKIEKENEQTVKNRETRYIKNIYKELLKQILKTGLKTNNLHDLILDLSNYLSSLSDFGSLFIVSQQDEEINILLAINKENKMIGSVNRVIETHKGIFEKKLVFRSVPGKKDRFYSYPVELRDQQAALIYIPQDSRQREHTKIEQFLLILSKGISLLSQMMDEKHSAPESEDHKLVTPVDIVGNSESIKNLVITAKKIARSEIFVLISGESGTGKELFARLIHKSSKRKKKNFVAINCAAFPESLLEAELFGYERGAFTGAYFPRKGKLELASGGTLVLDEIGDMPLSLQANLLRALQEQEFYKLGGLQPIKVDLRVISLTNKNLDQYIKDGKFREDLYYRLVHRNITIPPLRERKEDIPLLINFFTQKFCREIHKSLNGYSIKVFEVLQNFSWPGNVRQLENEIRSIVNLTDDGEMVSLDILSDKIKFGGDHGQEPGKSTLVVENNMTRITPEIAKIIKVLEKHNWNKTHAARELGMTYWGLHKKMKRLGIERRE
jgi:Nif-specific regulatory protein